MPFRSSHLSKRAAEKAERVKQLEAKEKKNGPSEPAHVNVFKSNQKLVVAKSTNHLDLHATKEVNNFDVNQPVVSKPSALLESTDGEAVQIAPNTPVVNGEVRADLVTAPGEVPKDWFPVLGETAPKKKVKSK